MAHRIEIEFPDGRLLVAEGTFQVEHGQLFSEEDGSMVEKGDVAYLDIESGQLRSSTCVIHLEPAEYMICSRGLFVKCLL